MRRGGKFRWVVRGAALALLALAAWAVFWLGGGGPARLLSRQLSRALGNEITVQQLRLHGFAHAAVENVGLILPDSRPFLFMDRVEIRFSYWGLLLGNLGRVEVSGWELFLFLDESGRPTLPGFLLDSEGEGRLPQLALELTRGRVEIAGAGLESPLEYELPGLSARLGPTRIRLEAAPPLALPLFERLFAEVTGEGRAVVRLTGLSPEPALAEAARLGWTPPFPLAASGIFEATAELLHGAPESGGLSGSAARIVARLPAGELRLEAPSLLWRRAEASAFDLRFRFHSLTLGEYTFPGWPRELALLAALAPRAEGGDRLRVESRSPQLPAEVHLLRAADGQLLSATGSARLQQAGLAWPGGAFTPDALEISFRLDCATPPLRLELEADGGLAVVEGERGARARGLRLRAQLEGGQATLQLSAAQLLAEASDYAAKLDEVGLTGRATLAGTARSYQAQVDAQSCHLDAASDGSTLSLARLQLASTGEMGAGGWTGAGTLHGHALAGELPAAKVSLRSDTLELELEASLPGGEARIETRGRLADLAATLPDLDLSAAALRLQAIARGDPFERAGAASVRLEFEEADASGLEGRFLGQGLDLSLALEAAADARQWRLAPALSTTAGVVLFDTLYASLEEFPLRLAGTLERQPGAPVAASTTAALPGAILEASASLPAGAWWPLPQLHLALGVQLEQLLPLALPALEPMAPSLAEATGSGRLELDLALDTDRGEAVGALRSADVDLLLPRLFSLLSTGVELELPFSLTSGATHDAPPAAPGRLRMKSLATPGLVLEGVDLPLELSRNRLSLLEPWRIEQYGGVLALHRLVWEDVLRGDAGFELEGDLEALDLGRASAAAGQSLFEGRLDAPDFAVRKEGPRYFLSRPLRLSAFGGEVHVSDLSVEAPGSRYMDLRANLEVRRLDLGRLTRVIPIGHITGILDGYARDVIIVGGEEMGFDIDLRVVPTRGVPQEISATAIRNLLAGTEVKVAASFSGTLSYYTYSKLGLKARLDAGILRLEGAEEEGGVQYFMVGSGRNKLNIALHGVERGIDYRRFRERLLAQMRGVDLNIAPQIQVR